MLPRLRADVEVLRTGPREFLLRDPASGEGFQLNLEERFLIECFATSTSIREVRDAFREKFDEEVSTDYVEQFGEQLRRLGLLEEPTSRPKPEPVEVEAPDEPVGRQRDPIGLRNHLFDWLTLLFGWVFHPISFVPLFALTFLGAGLLVHRWDAFYAQLSRVPYRVSLLQLALVWLVQITFCLSLPVALATGIACRKFGGRILRFRLAWLNRTLPYFEFDTGDSFVRMDEWQRWTMLTLGIWMHLAMGSLVLIAWSMAPRGSLLELLLLLLIVPSLVRLVLRLNVLLPLDGYAALSYWLRERRMHDRAKAQFRAWITGATLPEALPAPRDTLFLWYGAAVYVWKLFAHVLLIGGGGWLLTRRLGGAGAVIVIALVCWWYSRVFEDWIMSKSVLRWIVRGGGRWYIRWPIRLIVLAGLVACLFIPYDQEVGGDFRLLPTSMVGVRAPFASQIDAVHVMEGQLIEAGSPVATLAAREQKTAVETASAELDGAIANLEKLQAGTRNEKIEVARKEVELAQLRVDYHTTELARVDVLVRTDTISDAEYENARFQKESAEKMLAAAQQELAELEAGVRAEEVWAAEADVEQHEAMLKHREEELALAEIKAPISGRIVTAAVEERVGQYVQPGDLIAVIQDGSVLKAEISATQDAIPWLRIGQEVDLRFWGLNGGLVKARVVDIAGGAIKQASADVDYYRSERERMAEQLSQEDESRVVRVYAELVDPPKILLPEMTGYARIMVGPDTLGAALWRPIQRFLFVEVWSWLP